MMTAILADPRPSFYDFEALAASLPTSKYRPLIERIRRFRDAMSALTDLRECRECLDVLRRHDPLKNVSERERHVHETVSSALIERAIILYVRATKTGSKHRTFVPVRNALPEDLVARHERMVLLRDDAIAHFGPGPGGVRPPWCREIAALRLEGNVASVALLYSRIGIQSDLPDDLDRLLDYAVARLRDISTERADDLLAEVKRLFQDDRGFQRRVEEHALDLHHFFEGDEAAVKQVLEARPGDLPRASYSRSEFRLPSAGLSAS
jgi:hypothetical protein